MHFSSDVGWESSKSLVQNLASQSNFNFPTLYMIVVRNMVVVVVITVVIDTSVDPLEQRPNTLVPIAKYLNLVAA